MNHFGVSKQTKGAQGTALELKVCEGCGALWLRAARVGVYCQHCAERLAEMPLQRPGQRRGRRRKRQGSGPGVQKHGGQAIGPVSVTNGVGPR